MDMDLVRELGTSKRENSDLFEKLKKEKLEVAKLNKYLETLPYKIWELTRSLYRSFYSQGTFENDLSCLEVFDSSGSHLLGAFLTYRGHQLKIEKEDVHLKVSLIEMDGFLEKSKHFLLFKVMMTPLGSFLWKLESMLLHEASIVALSVEELFLLGSSPERTGVLRANFF